MLVIYPPAVRPSEPPLGAARAVAALKQAGREAKLLDLNLEALDWMVAMQAPQGAWDTWTSGALKRRSRALESLRSPLGYASFSRYERAVLDLNKAAKALSAPFGAEAGLANYEEAKRSPAHAADLLDAALRHEESFYHELFAHRLKEEVEAGGWEELGLSINYLSQALPAFALLGLIKARYPGMAVTVGGSLVTSWAANGADFSVFRHLARFVPGRAEDVLTASEHGTGKQGRARSVLPDFSDVRSHRYLSPLRIAPYSFSSGCPYRACAFCPELAEGSVYRPLPKPRAMDQLARLCADYSPGLLHFTDNEIAPLYLRALAESGPGLPWYGFARFSKALLDEGFCRALAASGCVMLQLGLESADQAVLDAMGKGTRVEEADRILENLKKAGIASFVYVLFGTPGESLEAARLTARFLRERAPLVDFLNIAVFNLPARGLEAQSLATRSHSGGELSLYLDFSHPLGFDRDKVRGFIKAELEGEPAIRAIMRRSPPVFTSNHAPFFLPGGVASKIWPT